MDELQDFLDWVVALKDDDGDLDELVLFSEEFEAFRRPF